MEDIKFILYIVEIFFCVYLIGYSTFLFLSVCVGSSILYKDMKLRKLKNKINKNIDIPISILVPAHNEEVTVCDTIKSLLNLDYNNYEMIGYIDIDGTPQGLEISNDGKYLFVTDTFNNSVKIYNTDDNELIKAIKVGKEPTTIIFV
jgi:YVTN family beta-propeller protein